MTQPVTAAVLAEALREAATTTDDLFERGVFDGGESMKAARMIHRWQGILDRYDAQVRAELEWQIGVLEQAERDEFMHMARQYPFSHPKRSLWANAARDKNHEAIALRRQIRALGGES